MQTRKDGWNPPDTNNCLNVDLEKNWMGQGTRCSFQRVTIKSNSFERPLMRRESARRLSEYRSFLLVVCHSLTSETRAVSHPVLSS